MAALGRSTNAARSLGTSSSSSSSTDTKPLIYPTGATKVEHLSTSLQELIVARHSICLAGREDEEDQDPSTTPDPNSGACNCQGLKPSKDQKVVLKKIGDQLNQDDEDEEEGEESINKVVDESLNGKDWKICDCGHEVSEHGRIAEEGDEERRRRIKVAIRMDELLNDKGKLLDFQFEDEDLLSLRKQIAPLGSAPISSTPLNASNPLKRKFDSPSSQLTSPEPEQSPERSRENEDDKPLPKHRKLDQSTTVSTSTTDSTGQGHGKQPAHSSKTVGGQAGEVAESKEKQQEEDQALGPDGVRPEKKPASNSNEPTISSEKAAGGMSVDPTLESGLPPLGSNALPPPSDVLEGTAPRRERPAITEERAGVIRFRVVENDGAPESMILLTGLKNIFQRQLPKMPREYITRLVMDRNHQSLAIVKRGLQVVGGITYRPFNHRKFAEIVFCAISSTEQVKGYGSHLMNHLKDHVKASSPVMHFLTYADNYAIGYFKKQGFTKEINLDRSIWVGYIKDYEGGTLMQCTMIPRVEYLKVHDLIASQKALVLSKIRVISQSHVVHPGLKEFENKEEGQELKLDPSQIPGLKESGWTPEMDEISRRPKRGPHHNLMRQILVELGNHNSSWPFTQPVNGNEVRDYYDVIKNPMDLSTMESKLENNQYATVDNLLADAQLIFDNCRQYNPPASSYFKSANRLEKFLRDELPGWKASAAV